MKTRLLAATGGAPVLPLAVLFAFNLVDEFDRVAFGVLSPEIRDEFGLSDSGIVAIGSIAGVTALLAALPIGVLADRFNRVRLAGVGAVTWAVMTVVAAFSPTSAVLVAARMGGGIGRVVNEPVHASLLTDYYAPAQHPKVFALHRLANPIGLASALLVGLLGTYFDWRTVFLLLCVPTFLLLPVLLRLREPARGESVDAEAAERASQLEKIGFGEARRQLFAVRSLRRLWIALPVLGVATLTLGQLTTLFFERVYGYGPTGRGVVSFLSGLGIVIGLGIGQKIATKALVEGRPEKLATFDGLAISGIGIGLIGMVVSPFGWLSALFNLVAGIAIGAYQPCYFSLVGIISPARVRAQAYAYAILFLGGGGLFAPSLASLGEDSGYRTAIGVLAVVLLGGGLVVMSAKGYVRRDADQAAKTLAAAAELDAALHDEDRALLTVRGLDAGYDGVQVLFGVDVEIRQGEIVALLGTNGAGKSTLLASVSGLLDPTGGAVFFDGRDITHADAVQTAQLGIVQMPGGKSSFPTLTVAEHFDLAGWLHTDDKERLKAATEEVLSRFPRLKERWDTPAGAMSGGEQQQLALGMCFLAKPKLLLIDELSLGLAPGVVATLLEMVRAIHAQGTTVVVVEQSVNVALTLAERAYFMEKGQVRFEGPTADLLGREDVLRSVFLAGAAGAAVPEQREAVEVDRSQAPVLSCTGLSVRFGGVTAVNDVDFSVVPGEVVGLVGANGAGKTTLFDLLSGYLEPSSGRVSLLGRDVTSWSPDRRAMAGLGRSFQDARIFGSLTVAENLAVSLERHLSLRSYTASGLFLPEAKQVEEDVAYTVEDLIELLGLGALRDKQVRELSTGSRRIVDLGMALAHDPSVLLLDEPSSGIAQKETEALGPLLLKLRDDTGCALLVIEHDMPLLASVCDRLVALELGGVIAEGTPDEVLEDERVVRSYLGGDPTAVNRSGAVKPTRAAPKRVRKAVAAK